MTLFDLRDRRRRCITCCSPTLLVDSASKDGVERRIDVFSDVLDDECLPVDNGSFDVSQPLLLGQLNHGQAVILFPLTQPFNPLRGESSTEISDSNATKPINMASFLSLSNTINTRSVCLCCILCAKMEKRRSTFRSCSFS